MQSLSSLLLRLQNDLQLLKLKKENNPNPKLLS